MTTGLTRSRTRGTLPPMPKRKPPEPEEWASVRMDPGGRIELPVKFRKKLGLKPGKAVNLTLDADGIHVWSLAARTRRVQAIARRYVPEGRSLSEELIAERIEEAKRE
jgi:bifunctional DNA-binding transcriptional regulator/antitoxin component of YhaV-PrlF toxin-antitoxin module